MEPKHAKKTDDSSLSDDAAEQIAALEEELMKMRDLAARAQADLQNAKGRIEREADDLRKFATESLLRRLLPTLDNFQRAFIHVPEELKDHEWVKGVAAIEQDLMRQMTDVGLKRMQSLGEISDPHRHEVLNLGPGAEGIVVEVYEEGYELHGKVIRPAKVRAGDGSASDLGEK
jgi:molecular chaperone GrpE